MNDIYNLFPEPIASYTLGREFTNSEKTALLNQDWRPSEGNQTSKNTFVLRKKNLENIREFIRLSISDFGRTVYDFSDEKTKLYITQSWMNRTMPEEFHHSHKHPNSIVSGTLYIETNDSDVIQFKKPGSDTSPWLFAPKQWNTWNCETWALPIVSGQLLLWRSYLPHSVPRTKGPNARYSLSFNTFVRGNIGEEHDMTAISLK
tara:strand:- start:242 stop:853 length:612 start_codon:yes stop_codon:yes gene_type:complete